MIITRAAIQDAHSRIAPHIRKTPLLPYAQISTGEDFGGSVTLKLELLQATGSFKGRGAMNSLLTLSTEQIKAGVVTASGGNHVLAIAR